jgi:hypothetical protein
MAPRPRSVKQTTFSLRVARALDSADASCTMPAMDFHTCHGPGNDFLAIDPASFPLVPATAADRAIRQTIARAGGPA